MNVPELSRFEVALLAALLGFVLGCSGSWWLVRADRYNVLWDAVCMPAHP